MLSTLSFRAHSLSHDTVINVILPDETPAEDIPTLYLLHGMHGNHESWVRKSNIERYAASRHIAVVMPEGENSFYHDMKYGKKYFTYIAGELPSVVRRVYRLSDKREKNFIAGLSMGGYGAVRTALLKPESYAAAASLSGCLDIVRVLSECEWSPEASAIWGDGFRTCAKGTDSDLFHILDSFPDSAPKPAIYACCGQQDSLYKDNITFRDYMQSTGKAEGFNFCFEDGTGIHDWVFWNKWVGRAVDRCLEAAKNG